MRKRSASRATAVQIGLLLEAVLLLDLALRSITRLPAWQRLDEARLLMALASGRPVDHTFMTFLPGTVLHFDITLVQFGYLGIGLPAAMTAVLLLLTLWVRGFSNRARLTIAIVQAVAALVMVFAADAGGGVDPLLLGLGGFVLIAVLAPTRWDAQTGALVSA